jgi:hypothetical protein
LSLGFAAARRAFGQQFPDDHEIVGEHRSGDKQGEAIGAFGAAFGLGDEFTKAGRGDRLHGWGGRIRTSMCRGKNYLFEKSQRFGFTRAKTVASFQENDLLCGRDCSMIAWAFARRCSSGQGFLTSKFESDMAGISNSNFDVQRGDPAASGCTV